MRSAATLLCSLLVLLAGAGSTAAAPSPGGGALDQPTGSFELVGQEPLMNRGMNAALAVHGDYAYVGSRTDAKGPNLNHAGVLVVDISVPALPRVVHEIAPPGEAGDLDDPLFSGRTSREMRIWPEQELLIVQYLGSNCSSLIHACDPHNLTAPPDDYFAFYDISGAKAAAPELVATYVPSSSPHEFFLWQDPKNPKRALIYYSGTSSKRLVAVDISGARQGQLTQIVSWAVPVSAGQLHSFSVSNDGTRAYLAHLTGGFLVADVSNASKGLGTPAPKLVTPSADRVSWPGPGAHSAVKLWKKSWVLVGDEVYGDLLQPPVATPAHGCPWGWDRTIDIADPKKPKVVAEYKLPQNEASFCDTDPPRPSSSFAAHNPTLTPNIAFQSWHAGGLQAIGLEDPAAPGQLAEFKPSPLLYVTQEDPALSLGQDKVVMWSFPVIQDGLIYVVDVRNGLYILRYHGPFEQEVSEVTFLEGNSTLGHAQCYEPPLDAEGNEVPPAYCEPLP